jgi:hypothetical protein
MSGWKSVLWYYNIGRIEIDIGGYRRHSKLWAS